LSLRYFSLIVFSIFLLGLFSFSQIAFADSALVSIPAGSSVPGCEESNSCFIPYQVMIEGGGEVTWSNDDSAAHTVTSGSIADGPDGSFDSFVLSGETFSVNFDNYEPGEYPYFCMLHPWQTGFVVVKGDPASDIEISVKTNKSTYESNDKIVVTGKVTPVPDRASKITLQIFSQGNLVEISQLEISNDGIFTETYLAAEPLLKESGVFVVRATYGSNVAETTFVFKSDAGDFEIVTDVEVDSEESTETKEVAEPTSTEQREMEETLQTDVSPADEKGGGCLIATATYDTELSPQVQMLREIRDNSLLQTNSGLTFMTGFNQFYYSFSPTIADWERENPIFKEAVKLTITPLITSLSLLNYANMDSEAEVLGYGISLILLNVGMYIVVPVGIGIVIARKL